MSRKAKISEPIDEVNEVEQDQEDDYPVEYVAPVVKSKAKPKKRVQKVVQKPAEVEAEVENEPEESEIADIPVAPRAAAKPKRPLSLWMRTLQENGYMCKGAAFKPTPKKGSPEYEKVRAAFDAKKNAGEK